MYEVTLVKWFTKQMMDKVFFFTFKFGKITKSPLQPISTSLLIEKSRKNLLYWWQDSQRNRINRMCACVCMYMWDWLSQSHRLKVLKNAICKLQTQRSQCFSSVCVHCNTAWLLKMINLRYLQENGNTRKYNTEWNKNTQACIPRYLSSGRDIVWTKKMIKGWREEKGNREGCKRSRMRGVEMKRIKMCRVPNRLSQCTNYRPEHELTHVISTSMKKGETEGDGEAQGRGEKEHRDLIIYKKYKKS